MSSEAEDQTWWDGFFAADDWPLVLRSAKPEEVTTAEVKSIEKYLAVRKGSRVLDIPSGNGRLGIPLALTGYDVTGIDLQPMLIESGNREAERLSASFGGRQADMRELPWWDEFDAAFCYFGSFGYFDDDGNRDFVEAVWRSIKPGAPFLIDTMVAETLLPRFKEKDWLIVDGGVVLEERTYDHAQARIRAHWTFVGGESTRARNISVRVYTYRELSDLLQACGFVDCCGYDAATGDPFDLGASRLVMVARKQA